MKTQKRDRWEIRNGFVRNGIVIFVLILLSVIFITSLSTNSLPGEYEPLLNLKGVQPFFSITGNTLTGAAVGVGESITIQETYCGGNYSSGNWIINGSVACSDEAINVTGDLIIQLNGETESTEFTTSSDVYYDLRTDSAEIVDANPDLDMNTPSTYTDNWIPDDAPTYEFYITMNETEHQIQIFINNTDNSDWVYGIDLDGSDDSGTDYGGDYLGLDILFGTEEGATDFYCYNITTDDTEECGNGDIQDTITADANLVQNYSVYHATSGDAMEIVINITGDWVDKEIWVGDFAGFSGYTTFKGSDLALEAGILNLTGVTLNVTGNITVESQLNVESSTIQFALTSNGSANFTSQSGSSLVINSSTITSNDSTMYWGWRVATGSFNITNNNISYNGITDNNDETANNFAVTSGGGLIYNNNLNNCFDNKGCLYLTGGNPTTNISHNNITSASSSISMAMSESSGTIVEHNLFNNQVEVWDGTSATINNNTFLGDGIRLGQSDSSQSPSGIIVQNNNFSVGKDAIYDFNSSLNNTLIYDNEFGEIRWTNKTNLTAYTSFSMGEKIHIVNNSIGISDDTTLINLNTTAELTFYGVALDTDVQICKNESGTLTNCNTCNEANNCSLSNFIVLANVSSFSNYSINGTKASEVVDPAPYWNTNDSSIVTTYSNTTYSEFNLSWYDDVNISIALFDSNYSGNPTNYTMDNGTLNNYNYSVILPAGGHYWRSYANDTVDQTNVSDYYNFTITEAASTVSLALNESSSNITVTNGSILDINCSKLTGDDDGTVNLYINGTLVNSGTGPLGNVTSFNSTGDQNATCEYAASQNYTTTSTIYWIAVVDLDVPPNVTLVEPQPFHINGSSETITVNFSCNVSDSTDLTNISLYITDADNGSFVLNQTTNINGTFNQSSWDVSLGINGNYTWSCLAYDNSSQLDWADENRTIELNYTLDALPYWDTNDSSIVTTYSNTTYSEFNLSWYDDVNISIALFDSNYSGNPTNYTMDNGTLNNYNYSVILPAGGHYWRSWANDSVDQINVSDYYNFTVAQQTSTVNLTLNYSSSNITVTNGSLIDINCSKLTGDDEGTVTLSINGTTYSTGTGGLGNATSFNNTGEHNATCVYTASQNYTTTSTIFWISVVDFDDLPNVTLIEPVANYVNDSAETITVNFSCSATDNYNLTNISLHLTDALNTSFAYNQTTSINGTTNESSWSVDIGINGNYTWSCIAYDNNSQFAWADENRTIILNYSAPVVDPAPYWNTNNSNYTVTYDNTSYSEFNISWYDDVSVSIVYFESNYSGTNTNYSMTNSTLNSYNYSALLPAGGHFWRSYANDSVNGLNTSDYYNFTITESASTVNLTLNYSSSNITVTNGSLIDINCSKLTGDDEGTVTLSINGTTYSTGTGGLGNATSFNNTGEHNATCVYTASQNYTTTSTIFWISVVAQDNAPNTTLITPTASYTNDSTENVNVDFNCTATDDTEIANISLYVTNSDNGSFTANVTTSVNGTTNSSNWTLSLGTGNYTWNCLTYDNNSQTAWGNNHTIVINRTNSTLESNISVGNSSTIHLVGREEHNVTIDSVTATSASITISSTPVTFTISVGETKNLDLEGGSSYDHAVTLSSVSGSSAVVTITPINVAVSSSDTTSTGGSTGGSSSSSSSSEAAAPATPTTPATIPGESRQPAAPSTPGESAQQAAPTTAGEDAQQGRQPLAGRAFWTDFKEIAGDYSTYWIGFVIFMILLIFVFVTVPKVMRRLHTPKKVLPPHHYFREPNTTPPRKYYPRKEQDKKVVKITKRKFDNDLDKEMDKINAKISGLRKGDILPSHKKSFVLQEIKKRSSYDKKLQGKLQDVNNQLQGYAKVQILKEPKDRSLNQKLKKVEKKLSEIDTIGSEKKTFVLREMKERASYNNRLEDKLREINNQLHGYAKLKKPKAYQNKKLIQKLKKVEKELAEVNTINSKKKSFVLKETRRRTSYNKKLEHKYDDVKEKLQKYTKPRRSNEPKDKKLLQKLKQVEKKLAKINKIEPPKKKSSIELREEQKAKNDVKRISKKIEKKRPAPPNELHNIEKKIKKLQDDIRNN